MSMQSRRRGLPASHRRMLPGRSRPPFDETNNDFTRRIIPITPTQTHLTQHDTLMPRTQMHTGLNGMGTAINPLPIAHPYIPTARWYPLPGWMYFR